MLLPPSGTESICKNTVKGFFLRRKKQLHPHWQESHLYPACGPGPALLVSSNS